MPLVRGMDAQGSAYVTLKVPVTYNTGTHQETHVISWHWRKAVVPAVAVLCTLLALLTYTEHGTTNSASFLKSLVTVAVPTTLPMRQAHPSISRHILVDPIQEKQLPGRASRVHTLIEQYAGVVSAAHPPSASDRRLRNNQGVHDNTWLGGREAENLKPRGQVEDEISNTTYSVLAFFFGVASIVTAIAVYIDRPQAKHQSYAMMAIESKEDEKAELKRQRVTSPDPPLSEHDPDLFRIIEREKNRQFRGLEMIASENFTSRAVMDCLGSCLTNKYSEGEAGARYYGGNEFVDELEILCKERALAAYRLDAEEWGVNVQPYSGSPANFAVYTGLLDPHDRIMGLNLPDGGHLTHGYFTPTKKISATSVYFESMPYHVDRETGLIDYDEMEKLAMVFRPKLLICGASAYPREIDFAKFREVADACGALLLADMAHISGLVAAQEHADPFPYCDVVTTTTHKSLRGPRSGMIFARKRLRDGTPTDFMDRINFAVFPGLQGGPHNHQIAGVATQLKTVLSPEWQSYSQRVKANARAMARAMKLKDWKLSTDGTDNHLILWDVRPLGLTGSKMEKVLELASISVNKNTVPGDKSPLNPSGIRIGTPALTSRGMNEEDFQHIVGFYEQAVRIAFQVQMASGPKLKDFVPALEGNPDLEKLKHDVEEFAAQFPMPGL